MISGLLGLLSKIGLVMDDVSVMTMKVVAKKTSAIITDDVAATAKKTVGFQQEREIPILIKLGSIAFGMNIVLLAIMFVLYSYYPAMFPYILMLGGLFLSYEGYESVKGYFLKEDKPVEQLSELDTIKSAVITTLILSLEIIVLAITAASDTNPVDRIVSVSTIVLVATIGIFLFVGFLVRLDNWGIALLKKDENSKIGKALLTYTPMLMKVITVLGTIAMLLIGGEIFSHNIEMIHHFFVGSFVPEFILNIVLGAFIGIIVAFVVSFFEKKEEVETIEVS